METPVELHPFIVFDFDDALHLSDRLFEQRFVIDQQGPHHHIAAKPYFILSRNLDLRIVHVVDQAGKLFRKFILQQQPKITHIAGSPDLVGPPVGTLGTTLQPEIESFESGLQHLFVLIIGRSRRTICLGHIQHPGLMSKRTPTAAQVASGG